MISRSSSRTMVAIASSSSSANSSRIAPPTKHLSMTCSSGTLSGNFEEVHVHARIRFPSFLGTTNPNPSSECGKPSFLYAMETVAVETYRIRLSKLATLGEVCSIRCAVIFAGAATMTASALMKLPSFRVNLQPSSARERSVTLVSARKVILVAFSTSVSTISSNPFLSVIKRENGCLPFGALAW